MAAILGNIEKCRVIEGNNDISLVKSIDVRIRADEPISATIDLFPEDVFVEIERMYTFINGVKYELIRTLKEGDAECIQEN